jgi:hypothetical protein
MAQDPPEVDVLDVMAAVEARVSARREPGPGEDLEALVERRLLEYAEGGDLDPELLARLLSGDDSWNLNPDYRIRSHRRGLDRLLVVGLKRLVRPLVRLYSDPVVERQGQINAWLARLSRGLTLEVLRGEQARRRLESRIEELERRLAGRA